MVTANSGQKKSKVKAIFEHNASSETELTIKPGDIINLISTDDDEWWEGELRGSHGFFPKLYVEVITDTSNSSSVYPVAKGNSLQPPPTPLVIPITGTAGLTNSASNSVSTADSPKKERLQAKAIFDFQASGPTELSINPGDIINIRSTDDEEWMEGELNGKVGYFPRAYVEIIEQKTQSPPTPPPTANRPSLSPTPISPSESSESTSSESSIKKEKKEKREKEDKKEKKEKKVKKEKTEKEKNEKKLEQQKSKTEVKDAVAEDTSSKGEVKRDKDEKKDERTRRTETG